MKCGHGLWCLDFWRDMGRSRKRLVDEKELLNKNKIISKKLMIFLMTGPKERL